MIKVITAADIWREVLEDNGYKFYDEVSSVRTDINVMEFFKQLNLTMSSKCTVYFNYKTGDISNVFFSLDDKNYFISQFNSKLRDYKLMSILD